MSISGIVLCVKSIKFTLDIQVILPFSNQQGFAEIRKLDGGCKSNLTHKPDSMALIPKKNEFLSKFYLTKNKESAFLFGTKE